MKLICIGRNYRAHALELKNEIPQQPVVFFKPASALALEQNIRFPDNLGKVHYECELVLKFHQDILLGSKIKDIRTVCDSWTLGMDFTARELQTQLKKQSLPWELAKSFEQAAFLGDWKSLPKDDLYEKEFFLYINGDVRQQGILKQLIFDFETLVNFCTDYFSIQKGDVLFTGTPQGVGVVSSGDVLEGRLMDESLMNCRII